MSGASIVQRLAHAVKAMEPLIRSETADAGKYTYNYVNLNDVLASVKHALDDQELVVMQPIDYLGDGYAQVLTSLSCLDTDETLSFPGAIFKVMNDPQATGSAISYARRYSLTTLFALSAHDDDGAQAHRSVVQPTGRTEAEKMIRKMVGALPDAMAKEDFQSEFVEHFGCTLTNLPENRHGDALAWAKDRERVNA